MKPPLPAHGDRWALFLDLDGTLAELAEHPDDVRVLPRVVTLLARLEACLDGALAVVSGRSIESLDALLHPMRPKAAGLHGLQRRDGHRHAEADAGALARAAAGLEQLVAAHPGLLLENKGAAVALHYRNAPDLEEVCRTHTHAVAARCAGHHVIAGKMVFEIKPRHTNKGTAIAAFLDERGFGGRRPVFAGDDVTDEDGFELVNDRGGISIKVGAGASVARFRLPDVAALHDWLAGVEARLVPGDDGARAP